MTDGPADDSVDEPADDPVDDPADDPADGGVAEIRDLAERFVAEHGFLSWLDVRVGELERGRATASIPFDERLTNPVLGDGDVGVLRDVVHGGVLATLADYAAGIAVQTTFDDPRGANAATTDLNVNYVRPATDDVRAEATVVRAGGSEAVVRFRITSTAPDGERKTVAVGTSSHAVFRE